MERYLAGCSLDCGGNCALQVYMEDGGIQRIGPDEGPDDLLRPRLRLCSPAVGSGA